MKETQEKKRKKKREEKKQGNLESCLLEQFYNKVLTLFKQKVKFKGTYSSFSIFMVTTHG